MQKVLRSKADGRILMYTPALAETGLYDLIDHKPRPVAEDVEFKETPAAAIKRPPLKTPKKG